MSQTLAVTGGGTLAVAVMACLPYLTLRTAWVAGSRTGIPAGSPLLDHPAPMAVAKVLTMLMDGAVIVLALLLAAVASAAAVVALFPLALRTVGAFGGTTGLGEGVAAGRGSDFHVLESLYAVFLLAAVGGGVVLAFGRVPGVPVRVPLALAGAGSGAVVCWGGWMAVAGPLSGGYPADRPTALMLLTYAGQVITGLLVATVGARFPAARSARRPVA